MTRQKKIKKNIVAIVIVRCEQVTAILSFQSLGLRVHVGHMCRGEVKLQEEEIKVSISK